MLRLPSRSQQYTSIWFGRRFEGADGTDCVLGIAVLADRQELVALMASMPTPCGGSDRMRRTRRGSGSRGPDAQGGLGLSLGVGLGCGCRSGPVR